MDYTEAYDDESVESVDDEGVEDESGDEEAFGLENILDPLGIRRLFTSSSRPPVPFTRIRPGARGVGSAVLQTPRGSATIRLPEEVVPYREFQQVTQRLEGAINRNTSRINVTERDVRGLNTKVATAIRDTNRAIAKSAKEQRVAIARLKKEQKSQAMNALLISILSQSQSKKQLEDHTHSGGTLPGNTTGTAKLGADSDSTSMILLPLLLMGQSGGSGDNSMMMMMLMMTMFK